MSRRARSPALTCAAGAILAAAGAAQPAMAARPPEPAPPNCQFVVEGALALKWEALGGRGGPLGCPIMMPEKTAASPQGAAGDEVIFGGPVGGAILAQTAGAHAGQTFAVTGCVFRTWFQYGGTSGWLGYPTSDPENRPDGQRQSFEGGEIFHERVGDACSATRREEMAAPSPPVAGKTRLDLFQDDAGHTAAIASKVGAARALKDGLRPVATLGWVFADEAQGLRPLKAYFDPATGDHDTLASAETERDDQAAGYEFDGLQGFVWADPHQGAVALKRFWNRDTRRSLLCASPEAEAAARAEGYRFVRIEGYLDAAQ